MEEKQKNTGLAVLIALLVLIILGLTGFIVYDKVLRKEKVVEPSVAEDNDSIEGTQIDITKKLSEIYQKQTVEKLVSALSIDYCGAYEYKFKNTKKITKDDLSDYEIFSILFRYNDLAVQESIHKETILDAYKEFFDDASIYILPKQISIAFHDYELNGDFYEEYASGGGCEAFSKYIVNNYNFNNDGLSIDVIYVTTDYNDDGTGIYIKGQNGVKLKKSDQNPEFSAEDVENIKNNINSFINYRFNFKLVNDKYVFDSIEMI